MFKMTCFFIPSWQNEMNLAEGASPLAKCGTDWSLQLNKTREATMILASMHSYMSVTMVRAHNHPHHGKRAKRRLPHLPNLK